jgi:parallel beta-helix repeat protein
LCYDINIYSNTFKNSISDAIDGDCGEGCNNVTVSGNTFEDIYADAVEMSCDPTGCTNVSIYDNVITNIKYYGLDLNYVSDSYIFRNNFTNASGSGDNALYLYNGTSNEIYDNVINDSYGRGVYFSSSENNYFARNNITNTYNDQEDIYFQDSNGTIIEDIVAGKYDFSGSIVIINDTS